MIAFISGPMTGYEDYNGAAFDAAEKKLSEAGFDTTINPARLGLEEETHERCMLETIRLLTANTNGRTNVDVLVLLDGWEDSEGARLELEVAHAVGIPCVGISEISSSRE